MDEAKIGGGITTSLPPVLPPGLLPQAPVKSMPVPGELQELAAAAARLEDRINTLQARLVPVRPQAGDIPGADSPRQPPMGSAPVTQELYNLTSRVHAMADAVEVLLSEVEL